MNNRDSTSPTTQTAQNRRPRTGTIAAILVALVISVGLLASLAEAGSRWFGGGQHGGGHGFDAERASEHAEFATSWVLRRIDANDEQEAKIQGIVAAAIGEFGTMRGSHGESHQAFLALLGQDKIDRSQLEELRAQQMAMANDASTLLATALADIADTLTVEQRAELLDHAESHRGRHGWRH